MQHDDENILHPVAKLILITHFWYMKQPKVYTPAQFAKKHGISRTTVWRWLTDKDQERRLKMYDARKIVIAKKIFIEV